MRNLSFCFCLIFCTSGFAQLPETEIWLMPIKKEKNNVFPGKPIKINEHKGYNNQPSFSIDSKSVFYVRADSSAQTDIVQFNLRSSKQRAVTATALSEYSPQEIKPGLLCAVVVEKDSAQKIHEISATNGLHQNVLEPDSVGYYCFLNADTIVYYKLTQPHSLRVFVISSGKEIWLGNFPTRGFKPVSKSSLVYCLKDSLTTTVYRYDFVLQKAKSICSLPKGNEDIFWHKQLGLLRSDGTAILQYRELTSTWTQLFDLRSQGFHRITRFAIDEKLNYLVVVDNL
jgi:hypothetical protein